MTVLAEPIEKANLSATEITTDLKEIWSSILSKENIGSKDEFFDLGGNSMLLLVMVEKIQERFDKEIALEDLAEGISIDVITTLLCK